MLTALCKMLRCRFTAAHDNTCLERNCQNILFALKRIFFETQKGTAEPRLVWAGETRNRWVLMAGAGYAATTPNSGNLIRKMLDPFLSGNPSFGVGTLTDFRCVQNVATSGMCRHRSRSGQNRSWFDQPPGCSPSHSLFYAQQESWRSRQQETRTQAFQEQRNSNNTTSVAGQDCHTGSKRSLQPCHLVRLANDSHLHCTNTAF